MGRRPAFFGDVRNSDIQTSAHQNPLGPSSSRAGIMRQSGRLPIGATMPSPYTPMMNWYVHLCTLAVLLRAAILDGVPPCMVQRDRRNERSWVPLEGHPKAVSCCQSGLVKVRPVAL